MPDDFEIELLYKGKVHSFPAALISTGYTYKIQVEVFGKIISFEPDEERNSRAIINQSEILDQDKIDKVLIKEIAEELKLIFKD